MSFEGLLELKQTLEIPFFAFLGAFVLYLLNRLQDKQPFSLFKAININIGSDARSFTILFDMLISSCLGAIVIIPLTSPSTVPQAIVAGLGMTGILSAHTKTTEKGEGK